MKEKVVSQRAYPSPAAQRRLAELWKARVGLASTVIIALFSLLVMFRIAGVGVQAMLTVSQNTLVTIQGIGIGLGLPLPDALNTFLLRPRMYESTVVPQPTQAVLSRIVPTSADPSSAKRTPGPQPAIQPTATLMPGSVREHTVEAGDTLFALARRYETRVQAIVAANNLRDSNATLRVGLRLIVP